MPTSLRVLSSTGICLTYFFLISLMRSATRVRSRRENWLYHMMFGTVSALKDSLFRYSGEISLRQYANYSAVLHNHDRSNLVSFHLRSYLRKTIVRPACNHMFIHYFRDSYSSQIRHLLLLSYQLNNCCFSNVSIEDVSNVMV